MANTKVNQLSPTRFELLGGPVCLDFINTLDDRPTQPKELLKTFINLARFAGDSGILTPAQTNRFIERSPLFPEEAAATLRTAREMREAMFAVFSAIVKKQPVPRMAMAQVNGYIQDAFQHLRLVQSNGSFSWEFDNISSPERPFDPVLWPIARSAAELLASDQLRFVRTCESETCQWFFLDTSKNHRRQWCDMTKCGNRAKARRFYARKKKTA
jgi:predicted RNA-binding Zn ribbon-like protein